MQISRGVIFSSTLSKKRTEQSEDLTHEVLKSHENIKERIAKLENDSFFNESPYNFNIIRR